MNIRVDGKKLFLQGFGEISFSHNIRQAVIGKNKVIVLLEIPYDDATVNNIVAVSFEGSIVWKVQNTEASYPVLPFEQMLVKGDAVLATDFYGRRSYINIENGEILKRDTVK